MSQRDERSPMKRRSRTNTGEPNALTYPASSGRSNSPLDTEYDLDEGLADQRQNTSVIRLDTPPAMQPSRITNSSTQGVPHPSRRQSGGTREIPRTTQQRLPTRSQAMPEKPVGNKNVHWLLPVGIGMVAMLVLWVLGSSVLAWGMQRYNDVRYGYPRTYQIDAVVGHNDSRQKPSHFIAINLNRQAVITEYMGGDPAKQVSYVAPVYIAGQNGDLAPITLEFRDVTGDGKLDMIIHIHLPDQDQVSVFVNDGTKFRPSNGSDKIRL